MTPALIAVLTTVSLLGILAVIVGATRAESNEQARMPSKLTTWATELRKGFDRRRQLMVLGGFVLGIILWLLTGWIVLLVAAPLAAIGVPILLGKGDGGAALERLEALETWSRSLAGLTVAGSNLEQTIAASLGSTPGAIKPYVKTLVARINARWSTRDALQKFADELADPTADLIVAHLLLAEQQRGSGLAASLEDLAEIIFEEVKVRRQIETDRAKPRSSVRIITIITLGILALIPFAGQFMEPYQTPLGQLALALWLVVYVAILIWLKRITIGRLTPRILENPRDREAQS